jgi:hypothetical protein
MLLLAIILITPNFIYNTLVNIPTESNGGHRLQGKRWEVYDHTLAMRLTSINDILLYAEKKAAQTNIQKGTLAYTEMVGDIVSNRFFH